MSELFIRRSVGTTLLTIALALGGADRLPAAAGVAAAAGGFPDDQVQAQLAGASPETMASSVATPLERQFGRIAGVTRDDLGEFARRGTSIVLQFDLNRNIDAAARDVQAAINAARSQLPTNLPSPIRPIAKSIRRTRRS